MPHKNNHRVVRNLSLVAAVAVVGAIAFSQSDRADAGSAGADPKAADPSKAMATKVVAPRPEQLRLIHAERFTVQQPFVHVWRADQPQVDSGWLMVLEGTAEQLALKQDLQPVLYVGEQTADRVNAGLSGRVVVIVPGDFDLNTAPIFFGPKALPEALDANRIKLAHDDAVENGAVMPTVAEIQSAAGNQARTFPTDYELRQRAIDLVEVHSPKETDLIAGWRVPRVK